MLSPPLPLARLRGRIARQPRGARLAVELVQETQDFVRHGLGQHGIVQSMELPVQPAIKTLLRSGVTAAIAARDTVFLVGHHMMLAATAGLHDQNPLLKQRFQCGTAGAMAGMTPPPATR